MKQPYFHYYTKMVSFGEINNLNFLEDFYFKDNISKCSCGKDKK